MGKRTLDKLLLEMIIDHADDNVTLVGPNDRNYLIASLHGLGYNVKAVDYDPKFETKDLYECKDAVYDNVDLGDFVVVCNAEKHYPIGKIHSAKMIVIGDNDEHNGDCNPVVSTSQLVEQNNFQNVIWSGKLDKWFIAMGDTNAA